MGTAENDATRGANRATVERPSERELVVRRVVRGPRRLVFEAWTRPELFMRWWVPAAAPIALLACELDVRVGGRYRLLFGVNGTDQQMEFFGRYLEVTPPVRLVWTNEEAEGETITTVPGPLPLAGAGLAFGWTRRLRRRLLAAGSVGIQKNR